MVPPWTEVDEGGEVHEQQKQNQPAIVERSEKGARQYGLSISSYGFSQVLKRYFFVFPPTKKRQNGMGVKPRRRPYRWVGCAMTLFYNHPSTLGKTRHFPPPSFVPHLLTTYLRVSFPGELGPFSNSEQYSVSLIRCRTGTVPPASLSLPARISAVVNHGAND